ncbi:MAG: hypothetical protein CMJ62_10340, partial [Planctomycetaceae bacterium]|nr:hypothetical protein [Planctomycetaceae bacterium]
KQIWNGTSDVDLSELDYTVIQPARYHGRNFILKQRTIHCHLAGILLFWKYPSRTHEQLI